MFIHVHVVEYSSTSWYILCHGLKNFFPIFLWCQQNIPKKIQSYSLVHANLIMLMFPHSPYNILEFCHIYESKIQGWNWFYNLWQLNGKRWKCCLWVVMFGLQHKEGYYSSFGLCSFLLKKYEKRKAHNILSLMLDYRFKTFHLVSSFIGCEQGKAIVEEYDKFFYFLCFSNVIIICIHWLNLKGVLLIQGLKRTWVWISLKW